jgi:hypothetical protein
MIDRHISGCIYCGSQGPFSDEHVVCAGLGGDDGEWLLVGCVCRVCNTDIFSKLETKFLRASPAALARLFLQPHTRKQGNKTGKPSVQPKVSYLRDPGTGILVEGELGAAGVGEVLPQLVVIDAQQIAFTGRDTASVTKFLSGLCAAFSDETVLIEKTRNGFEVVYDVTPLSWKDGAYTLGDTATSSRPPAAGFWVEPLTRPATAQENDTIPPRIFQRITGQFVARVIGVKQAAIFLTVLRNAPELTDSTKVSAATTSTQTQPGFHQNYVFDMAAYDRTLTKIGLNLVAKLLGLDLIRNPVFDASVAYARDGVGRVFKYSPENSVRFADTLGPALPDKHMLALLSGPGPNGGNSLVFIARLYGGPMEGIRLAEMETPIPGLDSPIIVHVDYVNHKIERLTLEEHALRVVTATATE